MQRIKALDEVLSLRPSDPVVRTRVGRKGLSVGESLKRCGGVGCDLRGVDREG